jgi:hypothetical protein
MTLNLYQTYKKYSQRYKRSSERAPNSYRSRINGEIKEIMRNLIMGDVSKIEMTEIALKMEGMESLLYYKINYASEVVLSIKENNYHIEVPHQIRLQYAKAEEVEGFVYLATTQHKKGQVKIGYTTGLLSKRESTYEYRWGYPINIVWNKRVSQPFKVEKEIKNHFKETRVAGLTSGDSNEWYYGDVDDFKKTIINFM